MTCNPKMVLRDYVTRDLVSVPRSVTRDGASSGRVCKKGRLFAGLGSVDRAHSLSLSSVQHTPTRSRRLPRRPRCPLYMDHQDSQDVAGTSSQCASLLSLRLLRRRYIIILPP